MGRSIRERIVREITTRCGQAIAPVPVLRVGVNDEFGHSGPAAALLKEFGLSAENLYNKAKEFLK